ncbi:uronyl 2-sulfotransferase-like isoform X2 [Saccoglossus kowalevskii]
MPLNIKPSSLSLPCGVNVGHAHREILETIDSRTLSPRKPRGTFSSFYTSLLSITLIISLFGIYSSFMRISQQPNHPFDRDVSETATSQGQIHLSQNEWINPKEELRVVVDGEMFSSKEKKKAIEDVKMIHPNEGQRAAADDKITPATGMPLDLKALRTVSRLIYNRVGKCGSRTLMAVTERAAEWNNFKHVKSQEYHGMTLTNQEEMEFISEVMSLNPPFIYNRHVRYVNFSSHGIDISSSPKYINLIRDPVDRKISTFYYTRFGDVKHEREDTKRNANLTFEECVLDNHPECAAGKIGIIPYFCGQVDACHEDHEWALETAKRNVAFNIDQGTW